MLPKLWSLFVIYFFYSAHASLEPCEILGQLKADAEKCENFYQCSHRGWLPLNCPDGLIFNEEISVCDWPKSGTRCGGNSDQSDISGHGSCNSVGELKAEGENCNRFYQCTRYGWTQVTCGHDLTFNPENSVCDWSKPGLKCGENTNNHKTGNDGEDLDDDAMLEICETVGQLKPDTENCERFYQCTRIGWAPVHCQEGFFYNSKTSVCDFAKPGTKCVKANHDEDENSKLESCEVVGVLKSNEENCQKFDQCTNLGWKQLTCPDGLFFNSQISVCDWPKPGTKCGEDYGSYNDSGYGSCDAVGELKGEGENCDLFYQCTRSGWMPLTCGHGLVFNKETSVCDWPKPGPKCGGKTIDHAESRDPDQDDDSMLDICEKLGQLKSNAEKCERFFQCTPIGWAPLHCQDGFYFNEKLGACDRSKSGAKCGGDDDDRKLEPCKTVGEFKSDDENCQKFYQCTNSGWKPLTCPNKLFFNSEMRVCDWPESGSKCEKDNSSDGYDNDEGDYEPCSTIGELKEEERNCDRFYQCTRLGWIQLTCGHDLTFNPDNLVCDWPTPGLKCGGNTNRNDQAGKTDQDKDDDAMLDICEAVGQLKPDAENCERFFQCTLIGWAPVRCQNGFHFNQKLGVCDRSKDGSKCESAAHNDDFKFEPCSIVGDFKLDDKNCQNFYQCSHQGWKPLTCPDGLFFNSEKHVCDWPQPGSKCGTENNSDGHDNDDGENHESCETLGELKEEERNCERFYQCTQHGWTQLTCGHDLTFNQENLVCDWPKPGLRCGGNEHARNGGQDENDDAMLDICENLGQLKPDAEKCERFYQCTRVGWAPVYCEDGFYFNEKLSMCDRSEDGSKCGGADHDDNSELEPCESVGQYKSDVENCHSFYQCTNKGWKRLTCQDDLVFNSEINVCEWRKPGFKCGQNDDSDDHSDDHDNHDTDLDPCENVGEIKADSEHCDLYYQCTSCGWTLVSCESGLMFDSKNLVCDIAERASCTADTDDNQSRDRNHDDHSEDDDHDNNPLEPCEKVSELKVDSMNCNRYYECTNNGWLNMPCYGNLAFNPDKLICDYTYNVKCGI